MKRIFKITIILFLAFFFIFPSSNANAYVNVKGYYRSNGTYVAPHVRSNPNGVKYDNYGYKPSQGLYNDSYGTKGTTWDTPSYVTDPDYYKGKSLYENNQSDTYYSPSYNSYTPTVTPSCPSMSSYDSILKSCKCYSGYSVETDFMGKETCVSNDSRCQKLLGHNSRYNSLSSECECSYGYEIIGSTCTYKSTYFYSPPDPTPANNVYVKTCPINSSLKTDGLCYCNTGYELSVDKTACIKKLDIACGKHAFLINGSCYCDWPYKMFGGECTLLSDYERKLTGKIDNKLATRLSGTILSQNEEGFLLWWVNPEDKSRYQLESSTDLFQLIKMKAKIYNEEAVIILKKNPNKVLGMFVIDKTNWLYYYVNPKDKTFYNIAPKTSYGKDDFSAGLEVLRGLVIGINNENIRKIKVGS